MAETSHVQTTATSTTTATAATAMAGGKGLVGALANGGSGGGGGGGNFGLGVGFALSPELAQKVRECRGVSSASGVPESSLTFLKAAATAADPNGTPSATGVAVDSSEQTAPSCSPGQRQRHITIDGDGGGGGDTSSASAQLRPTEIRSDTDAGRDAGNDSVNGAVNSTAAAAANGINGGRGSDGDDDGGKKLGVLEGEGSGQSRSEGAGARKDSSWQHEKTEVLSSEAVPQGKREEGGEAEATAAVADPPDSWEEFDETSVPPAAVVTVPQRDGGAPEETSSAVVAGCASASSSTLEPKAEDGDGQGGQAEEKIDDKGGMGLQSAPVLLVDLARVCGFRVKGAEEAEVVGSKVRAALHESFAERSEELFEMGSAVHADTSTLAEELHRLSEASSVRSSWAVVDYPAKLGGANAGANGGVDTSEAWAAVTAPSACRAVEAVRTALVGTNRHLVWKRDMLQQLEAVAVAEREAQEARVNQERQKELEGWRGRRREQLERLIEVRPMFERRRAMAEEKLIAAGGALEGEEGGHDGAAADPVSAAVVKSLDAKLESIDDLIARLEIEEGEEGYGFVPSDGDEEDDDDGFLYDGDDDDDQGDDGDEYGGPHQHQEDPATGLTAKAAVAAAAAVAAGEEAAPAEGGAAADAAARERAKKKNKKKKKKAGRPGVVEQLKAKALGGSADGSVDGVHGGGSGGGKGRDGADTSPPDMSLLDAVAAMILGRYPQDPRATSEQHFEKIATMHQQMKDAWVAEFGRLPPMGGSGSS